MEEMFIFTAPGRHSDVYLDQPVQPAASELAPVFPLAWSSYPPPSFAGAVKTMQF